MSSSHSREDRTTFNMTYPMYVMPIRVFVQRYGSGERILESHGSLRQKGLVTEWDGASCVLFISHEWTAVEHPDPSGLQTRELCALLVRLASGSTDVSSSWEHQVTFGQRTLIPGRVWKRLLAGGQIWFDYVSAPQPQADGLGVPLPAVSHVLRPEDNSRAREASDHRWGAQDDGPSSTATTPERVATVSQPLFTSVPRRRSVLRAELITAIESIPAYIERCSVFVTFAPTCVPGAYAAGSQLLPTSMVTWGRRGWTRAELRRVSARVALATKSSQHALQLSRRANARRLG